MRRSLHHKFNAIRTELNGIKFSSKKEANYYGSLLQLQKNGEVLFFLQQIPFKLPGGITYRCDFEVFYADGHVEFVEVKGFMTQEAKIKLAQVEEIYNIPIKVI
jgi:hypothetical protein